MKIKEEEMQETLCIVYGRLFSFMDKLKEDYPEYILKFSGIVVDINEAPPTIESLSKEMKQLREEIFVLIQKKSNK